MSRTFSVAQLIGVAFLAVQLVFILVTSLSRDSPRLLTPIEGLTRYEVHATMDTRALEAAQIRDRYGIPSAGRAALTAAAIQQVVAYREQPIPLSRALYVRLHTRQADGTEEYWLWPQE